MPKYSSFVGTALSTLVCMLALELGFRAVSGVPILALADWRRARDTDLAGISQYDPVVGWRTKEGVRSNWINTIAYGIRKNRENDATVRPGGVLVVGDSFAAGTNVNDDQTWPAYLEALIHQPVLNAAVGGWGVDQMVLRVGQLLSDTQPKTVILAIQDSGILRDLYAASGWPKPYYLMDHGEPVLHNDPVPAVVYNGSGKVGFSIKQLLSYSYVVNQVLGHIAPDWWYSSGANQFVKEGSDPVPITCALGKLFVAKSKTAGFRPVFVMQYSGDDIVNPRPDYVPKVIGCFRDAGITVVNSYEMLRPVAERSLQDLGALYQDPPPAYGHMTTLGNERIAQTVAAAAFLTNQPAGASK